MPIIENKMFENRQITFNHISIFSIFIVINKFACSKTVGNINIVRNISLQYNEASLNLIPNKRGIKKSEKDRTKV